MAPHPSASLLVSSRERERGMKGIEGSKKHALEKRLIEKSGNGGRGLPAIMGRREKEDPNRQTHPHDSRRLPIFPPSEVRNR